VAGVPDEHQSGRSGVAHRVLHLEYLGL
jgi:hypothetical protein